ncbi:AraC family transcriptional regulator [Nocardia sp. 2]|uniref:AraC family transcriptional regulator n=2 Tax=Nocardia acididurans TaxID=2802282 RepID=A0ABS1MES3_9NOCA|nr:AraC family transcriptional regulator [Nocardia acididurans]
MRPIAAERELDGGWEVVRSVLRSVLRSRIAGLEMSGFRNDGAHGVDVLALARPVVTVAIILGDKGITVENGAGRWSLDSYVGGMSPGAHRVRAGSAEGIKLRLSPVRAYALLGVSPLELNDSVIGLEDLWGRAGVLLREQLTEAVSWQERFDMTATHLLRHRSGRIPDPEVRASWHHILAGHGRVAVADLAEASGWSRKRLWARFSAQIGVTPKHAARVVRFRRAFNMLLSGASTTRAATDCGFADQPHLHREISAFTGLTPNLVRFGAISPDEADAEGTFVQDNALGGRR